MAAPAQGDILYRDAAVWKRLPAGTAGNVLTTNGAGANPSWAATGGGGGTVTNGNTLTANELIVGNGGVDLKAVAATDGQIPIGKTSDGTVTLGTITAGTGISVTNAAAAITIAATASTPAMVQLAQIVTSGSQTTVDFTSISGSYTNLVVQWIAQNSGAGSSDVGMNLKINNDGTSGNYTSSGRTGVLNGAAINGNVAASASGAQIGTLAQSGTTSSASAGDIIIPGYAQTTFHKRVLGKHAEDTTSAGIFIATTGFRWKSTAAITRLTFAASDGTAFTDGSIFTLYGTL